MRIRLIRPNRLIFPVLFCAMIDCVFLYAEIGVFSNGKYIKKRAQFHTFLHFFCRQLTADKYEKSHRKLLLPVRFYYQVW